MDPFDLFVPLVRQPGLILLPFALFAVAAWVTRKRPVIAAAAAWALYGLYELGNSTGALCSGECNIRADLIAIVPALLALSLWAALSALTALRKA